MDAHMWFALFWPFLAILILVALPELRRRMVPWEYALPWVPCLIMIPLGYTIGESIQTRDVERWAGYATEVRYYEDWNEYIHQTCTRSYPCGTDSKGQTTYCTETYDCSYVDYHPEYWELRSTTGTYKLSQEEYYQFMSRWGGRQVFVDLHRNYHTDDGDMYKVVWDQQESTLEPTLSQPAGS